MSCSVAWCELSHSIRASQKSCYIKHRFPAHMPLWCHHFISPVFLLHFSDPQHFSKCQSMDRSVSSLGGEAFICLSPTLFHILCHTRPSWCKGRAGVILSKAEYYRAVWNNKNKIAEKLYLAQGCCKGLVGTVEASSELGADASGQFGSAETFNGVLGHFPLPLWSDGRRVHKRYPVDYLGARHTVRTHLQKSQHSLTLLWLNSLDTDLFDLLPEKSCDRGSWMKGDFHMIGSI